jgi:two-component system, chemotaxis family, CheB/CheR fusion protein
MPPQTDDAPVQKDRHDSSPDIVVGIGASAGGVAALKQFFSHVPADTRAAFVAVLHLSPDYESRLAEVLQSTTPLDVVRVNERTLLRANRVYVVPPNRSLSIDDGHLAIAPLTTPEQRHAPVDILLRTLAISHGATAAAVVLSGTGANGSSGIKWIKEYGGVVMVQDPAESEFSDMPRNSLATGLVDYVLPVAAIPGAISKYFARPLPPRVVSSIEPQEAEAEALHELLRLLRVKTGHDFSNYKQGTVLRRVARRMHVHNLPTIRDYVRHLRDTPEEPPLLLNELLISVTNFFRDPQAYEVLQQRVIPRLFDQKSPADQVRVWVAGCATGEEAYSLAMLLVDEAAGRSSPAAIQVFATDLDARAINVARDGLYTNAEVEDVSEERLRRFFTREAGGYRVRREVREVLLFAHHNLIKDPPFSHLDLIVCRNVMIYLNRAVQQRVIEAFHFALKPSAYLFLGSSETADAAADLFAPLDKSARIYESRAAASRRPVLLTEAPAVPTPHTDARLTLPRPADRTSPADLHQRLVEQYAPPSIVVTDDYQVVHVSDTAAQYLAVSGGEPSRDLFKLVRPELRVDLRTAMSQALRDRARVDVRGVRLPPELGSGRLTLGVRPVLREGEPTRGFLLILFDPEVGADVAVDPSDDAVELTSPTEPPLRQLETELEQARRQLSSTIEQYESHVEEAKASNEELQAMNEELRSAAEELETSKEELQSVNEELTTVNQELKIKIEELALTNNDFQNFINATDIGTVFLDRSLRIKLFTARACDLFNLMKTDIGRPLSHITSTLQGGHLHQELERVLDRLQPVEREVESENGRSYQMRILPYRTSEDHIEGVVITFLEITSRLAAEATTRLSEERLRLLIDGAIDYAIYTMNKDGLVDFWNAGAERMFGYTGAEIVGQSASVLYSSHDQETGVFKQQLEVARNEGRASHMYPCLRKDGSTFSCTGFTTRLGDSASLGFATLVRDLSAQHAADEALALANASLEQRVAERTLELQAEVSRHATAQGHVTRLMQKLVTAQEEQRARIARDLHDQLGQQLTTLRLTLERLHSRQQPDAAENEVVRALALTRQIDTEVDFLAWELRPALLDDLGLAAALPQFVAEWSTHYKIPTEVRANGLGTVQTSREVEITFYRIAQEALNNIVKHAHASRADVILESRDGSLVLVVEDDGVGFDLSSAEASHGIGLLGMRERAALVGATLDVESSPGNGTSVFLRAALTGDAQDEGAVA